MPVAEVTLDLAAAGCLRVRIDTAEFMAVLDQHNTELHDDVAKYCVRVSVLKDGKVTHGTGFQYCTEPLILTAGHILDKEATYTVTYHDKVQEAAELVLKVDAPDIGVLRVKRTVPGCRPSKHVQVGQTGYIFGYPHMALDITMTSGTVSAVPMAPGASYSIAAIADNGSSGGPVVDAYGNVVGIVQMGVGSSTKMLTHFVGALNIQYALDAAGLPLLVG